MCGLNPPPKMLEIWRKNLLQFQGYRIFPRGLFFWRALYDRERDISGRRLAVNKHLNISHTFELDDNVVKLYS